MDTLHRNYIISIDKGDTLKRDDKIYFTSTDQSINTSHFYFEGCNPPCMRQNIYKIYFEREKVVEFCDSMLSAIPEYRNQGDDTIFYRRISYSHLKEQAANNKMDEAIYVDELPILLDRFRPLMVNTNTLDKPPYIIVTYVNETHVGYKTHSIKTRLGDTIVLSTLNTRPHDIELKDRN